MSSLIIALDFPSADAARALIRQLHPGECRLKIGKELFVSAGPDFVRELTAQGWSVFLDLKFHDIPQTVANACRAAAELDVWMVNVHALGGPAMLAAAREGATRSQGTSPLLTAVTVLTSHDQATLAAIGLTGTPDRAVLRLTHLAEQAGLDGVVCSAQEASALDAAMPRALRYVTPGIRLAGDALDDQHRIMTPSAAIAAGATDLVIGRPITQAADPLAALQRVRSEIERTV